MEQHEQVRFDLLAAQHLQALKLQGKRGMSINEVGAFYWTVLAPDIVNPGREEQGSVSV